jgi:hypothetical protein
MEPEPLYLRLFKQFKTNPWRNSLALIVSLLAVITTSQLIQDPLIIVALIQLVPLVVVITDSVRDRLAGKSSRWPGWMFVLVNVTVFAGSVGLLLKESSTYSFTLLLSLIAVFITLLPRLLAGTSLALAAIPYIGRYLKNRTSPANLYIILLLSLSYLFPEIVAVDFWSSGLTSIAYFEEAWIIFGLVLLAMIPAFIWRQLLWEKDVQWVFARSLPHLSAGLLISVMTILILKKYGLELNNDAVTMIFGVFLIAPISIAYWPLQNLQGFTVKPLTQLPHERSDSIQSDTGDYIDVHGHSARLVSSIYRSDAGVFGITGVRGAGKSALTRHVLSQLKEQYFVLEMTAPVRHDADMGFFMSVCRSVSRKVLDDLDVILSGRQSGDAVQLKRRFRNATLSLLLVLAASSWLWHFNAVSDVQGKVLRSNFDQDEVYVWGSDRLLGYYDFTLERYIILATERKIIDKLLLQIDSALAGQTESDLRLRQVSHYLLLPLARGNGFYLATDHDPYQPEVLLKLYRQTLELKALDPVRFLNIVQQVEVQVCNLSDPRFDGRVNNLYVSGLRGQMGLTKFVCGNIELIYDQKVIPSIINSILQFSKIKAPLAQLNSELRDQLFTRPIAGPLKPNTLNPKDQVNPSAPTGPQTKTTIRQPIEPNLVSLLMLEAFKRGDVRLSFDSQRLEILREFLRIYRRLLDGEVTELAFSTTDPAKQAIKKPSSIFSYLPGLNLATTSAPLFWFVVLLIILVLSAGPVWRAFISLSRAVVNRRYLDLYHQASKFLNFLSWSSSEQESRSVGFKGISLGKTRSRSARDLTLPGLNSRYLSFIKLIRASYNRKLIIVIDELDKIHDPEQVKALLTEIKGALFSKGCFYLISISEDAARSFRYRLTSGRDIFESTFDEIIEIQQMDASSAIRMLGKREENIEKSEKLPEPFAVLLVLFGGGIPREIIRAARALSLKMEGSSETSYGWACRVLLVEELSNWISHFGETNLSGKETVILRDCAQQALALIEGAHDVDAASYAEVSFHLQRCLGIIDPDELRKSVGYVVNVLNANGDQVDDNKEQSQYKILAADIQASLRVMILATISELTVKTDNDWQQYEKEILACHHALGDKPTLAETLLLELRNYFSLSVNVNAK